MAIFIQFQSFILGHAKVIIIQQEKNLNDLKENHTDRQKNKQANNHKQRKINYSLKEQKWQMELMNKQVK
ncbi:hypothetical protein TTHERM_01403820 (macronuclear) [Tetrahymena thermophila SB210]|uniref:Uncharacterized protein n=1 Tax=Tetrahymena thermophila (strain SB210) TaxID=312017 RepID=Q24H83_TETTS|nr:hypothetical protein TTHERM_01403820 [Tetrahymena thermophila SB210]EAS07142.1 hypothetical protein TTHERM_01403820 [Tetrahymena thermophila SB210]|eukprot:XP_001027384.1 hypothetical protein TTHERM_01403820 [Tetrahymena thermophila SB210]